MKNWLVTCIVLLGTYALARADSVQPIVPTSQVTYGSQQKLITSNSDVKVDTTTHQFTANKGIVTTTITWGNGTISTGPFSGAALIVAVGSATLSSQISKINFDSATFTANQNPNGTANITSKVDTTTAVINYDYLFNGSKAVWAPQGTNFSFSIASFSDGQAATIEAGTGVWKTTGTISFSATYSNGPPTASTVTFSGWAALPMTNSFLGPTATVANTTYPAVTGTVVFTLNATNGVGSPTSTITHTFNNDRYWGVNAISSGVYSSADIRALASNDLANSIPNTFTVNAGAGQYIVFAYPSRLGTASFTVNGFAGGFQAAVTASVTNASALTENYSVYRSVNANLGSTTVVVTTP